MSITTFIVISILGSIVYTTICINSHLSSLKDMKKKELESEAIRNIDAPLRSFAFSVANLVGTCPKCGEPSTGELDTDRDTVTLECVSCYHQVTLRYRAARVILEETK